MSLSQSQEFHVLFSIPETGRLLCWFANEVKYEPLPLLTVLAMRMDGTEPCMNSLCVSPHNLTMEGIGLSETGGAHVSLFRLL